MKIAFIGGGNMASALIGGLYAAGGDGGTIQVADPAPDVKQRLQQQWPVTCFNQAKDAIDGMEMIVLAVKPQILPLVLREIGPLVNDRQLILSIVAGIPVGQIAEQLLASPSIIRTMPNMPALIGLGITAMYAQTGCSRAQRDMAGKLMRAAGEIVWLDEEGLLDVVTAVSGSGPAYFFYLIEAMRNAGTRLGLTAEVATKLAVQTAYGACTMAKQSELDVAELRQRVTSKGGTTQAALDQFAAGKFDMLVDSAIAAATRRGQELAKKESSA